MCGEGEASAIAAGGETAHSRLCVEGCRHVYYANELDSGEDGR